MSLVAIHFGHKGNNGYEIVSMAKKSLYSVLGDFKEKRSRWKPGAKQQYGPQNLVGTRFDLFPY